MSLLKKTSSQSFIYSVFQGVGLLVSLASFPITTRIFSIEDYGNLVLINTTISLMIAFAKCGITTSFIRHYHEYALRGEEKSLYSSALGGNILITASLVLVYVFILVVLKKNIEPYLFNIFLIIGLIILLRNTEYLYTGFFRAEEKVLTLNLVSLLFRVGSLTFGIVTTLFLIKSLSGYFLGILVFEAVMVFGVGLMFYGNRVLEFNSISPRIIEKLYRYGIPLTIFEIAALINDYADRFLIKFFLGSSQVGIYSAGYNLSLYVKSFVATPIWMSVFPIYTKLWETEGKEKTEAFLSTLLKYYFCIGIFIVFIVSLLSGELIVLLATDRYALAAQIVPFIVASVIIYESTSIINAGYFLLKQTKKIAFYVLICAALNIIINLYFIPKFGIKGAAYSSVISYIFLTVLISVNSRKLLKITWPSADIIYYLCFSAIIALILYNLDFRGNLLNLVFKSLIGFLLYTCCILVYDTEVRKLSFSYIRGWSKR